jgi:serine/threonine-protein kinase
MSENSLFQPAAEDPRIGTVVKDYRIIRKIGEGGMGAVYEGEHTLIKRKVAVKCLHSQFATNPEIVARFHNEAMAANAIEHPNIVQVTDMGRFDDGTVFMVLELLRGLELAQLIAKEGPQTLGRTVHIISQACNALQAAHDQGIIHRDLKPENIFLIKHGPDPDFVKVLDFGIAKFKEGGSNKSMTRTGTTMGTPYYMAPEQAQAKKDVDHRADIYSLGVILFHTLTGQYPFDDESYPMLVVKICTAPPPPLRQFRPDIPEEFENLVNQMLEKDPSHRPTSCGVVAMALAPYRGMTGAPVLSDSLLPHQATMASIPNQSGFRQAGTSPHGGLGTDVGAEVGPAPPAAEPGPHIAGTQPIGTPAEWSGKHPTPDPSTLPPARGAGRSLLVIGLIACLLGIGGLATAVALGAFGGADEEVASATETEEPVAAPDENPVPPTAVPAAEPQATVQITIETRPDDARLFLDGAPIANPFDGHLPQGSEVHNLRAERDGYRTDVRDLVLMVPQNVAIRLRRGRGTVDRREHQDTPAIVEAPTTMAPTVMAVQAPTVVTQPAMVEPAPAMVETTTMVEATVTTPPPSDFMRGLGMHF